MKRYLIFAAASPLFGGFLAGAAASGTLEAEVGIEPAYADLQSAA